MGRDLLANALAGDLGESLLGVIAIIVVPYVVLKVERSIELSYRGVVREWAHHNGYTVVKLGFIRPWDPFPASWFWDFNVYRRRYRLQVAGQDGVVRNLCVRLWPLEVVYM
jgi:hypothetical protein